jgi:hypothetical protein
VHEEADPLAEVEVERLLKRAAVDVEPPERLRVLDEADVALRLAGGRDLLPKCSSSGFFGLCRPVILSGSDRPPPDCRKSAIKLPRLCVHKVEDFAKLSSLNARHWFAIDSTHARIFALAAVISGSLEILA